MTSRQYIYRVAAVVKVTDGDTYWMSLNIGFRNTLLVNVRLNGYDCPESNKGSEFERAQARVARIRAVSFLVAVVPGSSLWVWTEPDPDSFGRWLGDVWLESDTDQWPARHLGAELRAAGLASVWPTRWRDEFDTGLAAGRA